MKRKAEHLKDDAAFLYCVKLKAVKEICAELDLKSTTVYRWREEEKWDELKTLGATSPWKIAYGLLADVQVIRDNAKKENRPLNNGETDRIVKLVKSAKQIYKPIEYISTAIDVMARFSDHLKKNVPDLYEKLATLIMEFSQKLSKEMKDRG